MKAVAKLSSSRLKIGTIAMDEGLMTASEVDECLFLQSKQDKRFGEIAQEKGYLTGDQIQELLEKQKSDYLLLGQILVEDNCFSYEDFERYLFDYQQENEIFDLDFSSQNKDTLSSLIEKFFFLAETPPMASEVMYLELLFNNLIRFIGEDFTPLTPMRVNEYPVTYSVSQRIEGRHEYQTHIDMDRDVAIRFANRYANENFDTFDDYVMASIEDFLNLHNGLFLVNASNETNSKLELGPPTVVEDSIITSETGSPCIVIPVVYPFGTINFICIF